MFSLTWTNNKLQTESDWLTGVTSKVYTCVARDALWPRNFVSAKKCWQVKRLRPSTTIPWQIKLLLIDRVSKPPFQICNFGVVKTVKTWLPVRVIPYQFGFVLSSRVDLICSVPVPEYYEYWADELEACNQ